MRHLRVDLPGRVIEVAFAEPAGCPYEVRWYLLGNSVGLQYSATDLRLIEAACLHELIERRSRWRRALEARRA